MEDIKTPKLVIGSRVFLQNLRAMEKEDQKIITIEYNETIKKALVTHVGEDVKGIEVGDQVVLQMPCGLALEYADQKYQVVQRGDIILVV